jgi:hypothetical protein
MPISMQGLGVVTNFNELIARNYIHTTDEVEVITNDEVITKLLMIERYMH